MNIKDVSQLIKLIDESDLAEFQYKTAEVEIKIRSSKFFDKGAKEMYMAPPVIAHMPQQTSSAPQPSAPPASNPPDISPSPAQPKSNFIEVKSPMVGTFYRSSSPDKPPFVQVGDNINSGSVVCIIEAMKLFNEIESEVSGKIVKIMVEDATPVEYDQVLFLVEA